MDVDVAKKKPKNPRQNANPLSVITFFYTFSTFFAGYKREFEVPDLYETLNEHKSGKLGDKLEKAWNAEIKKAKKNNKTPSLLKALTKAFGWQFLFFGFVLVFNELFIRMIQPLFLSKLIQFFGGSDITIHDAYLYALGVVLCSFAVIVINHPYIMSMMHIGMKLRVACCSLIYRKSLKLSKTALGQTTVGQIVNLLSNDVNRFDIVCVFIHHLWVGPLQTLVAMYLMYREVTISAVIGVVFLLLFIPLQFVLGKLSSIFRMKIAIKTDERVRLMNEIISGIQVIKMYTWEKPFAKLVSLARRTEISSITTASYIRGVYSSFMVFTTRTALFITILAYVLIDDNSITAQQVFMITSYYNILRQSMTVFFPQGLALVAETKVSVHRLNQFLLYDEKTEAKTLNELDLIPDKPKPEHQEEAIVAYKVSSKWTPSLTENTLTNLNFSIKKGNVVAVIGPVGSGKTSLFHAILKELRLLEGIISVDGTISYASQEPWLFTGSVRQNILFGQEMKRPRYNTVCKKCSLERDFALLPYADKTIVGERGVSLSGGQRARINLARAVYKDADIYLLDDPLSAVDTHVGKQLFNNCIRGYLSKKTVILITHQLQYLQDVDHIIILESGNLKVQGSYNELQNSGLDFAKLLKSGAENQKDTEKPVFEEQVSKISLRKDSASSYTSEDVDVAPNQVEEQKGSGSVGGYVYKAYTSAGGHCCAIFMVVLVLVITQVFASLSDYFLSYWTNLEQERESGNTKEYYYFFGNIKSAEDFWNFSREECIYIYTGLIVATIVLSLSRGFAFFKLCMRASVKLHDTMFNSITLATMRFFNTNSSGRILNRFSKDMGSIDERLPLSMVDCLQIGLALMGIIVVVATVNPWLLIPTAIISFIFYLIRVFYLKTARTVKRLEGVTRSPVFAHLSASLSGLATIRAFGAEAALEKEFDSHQDLHSSAWFIFISSSTAYGYWLDIICVVYIAIVTFSFLVIDQNASGGNVGLAITQSLALTGMFQWGMRQTAELENNMTAVERVLEYTSVEHEPSLESSPDKKPPPTWPQNGEITFVNLFLYYFLNDPPVLKNLNFTIKPLEKVGIVGRTGAGKSSLISALFRLSDIKGSIIIDKIDITQIGLHDLRSKISIIPQEPVLFSGSMRRNLDPFNEYSDDLLWKALQEVELKEAVTDMGSGLDSKISEGGTNFSVGQRQLVCLARAIIRNNKILVLDEATANVDPQTDRLIQHTIRNKFADCTVLTIAHRLNTIMDSDKVIVMDAGSMIQFDHPHILLQEEEGIFYSMVGQTGKAMAEVLTDIAANNYNKSFV